MKKLEGNCYFGCILKDKSKRFNGNKFSIDGILCARCHNREYKNLKNKQGFNCIFNIKNTIVSTGSYYSNSKNMELLKRLKISEECDRICFEILKINYKVDIENGCIISLKTNTKINEFSKGSRYLFIRLQYSGKRVSIRLHRAIGMFKFGLDNIIGKEIGHKDKNPKNNRGENLELYTSRKEHLEKDGIGPGKNGLVGIKTEWEPCIKCGIKDGFIPKGKKSPLRCNGKPYGFNGKLCGNCYYVIRNRILKGLTPIPEPIIIKPCSCCGVASGYTSPKCKRPSRLNGKRFGYKEKLCHTCFNRLNHSFKESHES